MGNLTQGVAAEVLYGPARILIAAIGSTVPDFDGPTHPIVWDAAWEEVGYTDDGVMLGYNQTIKNLNVDEEMAPIHKILDGEQCTLSAKLAQATLDNMQRAISSAILTTTAAAAGVIGRKELTIGTGSITEVMVGFEGKSPAGLQRLMVGWRAIPQGNVQMAWKRSDKLIVPAEWGLVADPTKPAGQRLLKLVDVTAPPS